MEQSSKKGAALIYVVLFTALLIILGSAMLNLSFQSYEGSVEETQNEQAYLSAKSGLNFFLNALNNMTSDEIQTLYEKVVAMGGTPYNATITLTGSDYEVGDLTINLTKKSTDKIEISASSVVRNTKATATAYLQRSESVGGFDLTKDKPFYVYNTYNSTSSNVDFGSYKQIIKTTYDGFKYTDFASKNLSSVSDQYLAVNAAKNNLTEIISDAFAKIDNERNGTTNADFSYSSVNVCYLANSPRSNNSGDYDFANDLKYQNCKITSASIPTVSKWVYSGGYSDWRDSYRFIFDLDYTYSVGANTIGQNMTYIDPLTSLNSNQIITFGGIKFYADDVVYLSLRNPSDLSKISVEDIDGNGSYKYTGVQRDRNWSGSNSSSSNYKNGYYYYNELSLENYNPGSTGGILTSHPTGSNTVEADPLDANKNYYYFYDGTHSNNIIILIDNIDPAYATNQAIHISNDLDAWVYAPDNDVVIDSGVTVNGGVIANSVVVNQGAVVNGVTPNEGFMNILNSKYVDISWEVVYE